MISVAFCQMQTEKNTKRCTQAPKYTIGFLHKVCRKRKQNPNNACLQLALAWLAEAKQENNIIKPNTPNGKLFITKKLTLNVTDQYETKHMWACVGVSVCAMRVVHVRCLVCYRSQLYTINVSNVFALPLHSFIDSWRSSDLPQLNSGTQSVHIVPPGILVTFSFDLKFCFLVKLVSLSWYIAEKIDSERFYWQLRHLKGCFSRVLI